MDFARKQLEKFGWKDGTGLGKDNQGRVEAIKPALKVGKEGMGYDFSKELTDTWWTRAYDDSLKRINVDEESETVGVTLQEDDEDDSTKGKTGGEERPFQKMRKRMMKATFTTFSKGATLSNGEMLAEPKSESDEECEKKSKELHKLTMTDEELLKACGGRTAHKAARFGLKLNGKLARIAAQEAAAMAHLTKNSSKTVDQYSKISNVEDTPENTKEKKKRKKKRSIPEAEADLQGTSVPVQIHENEEIPAVTNETGDEPPKKKKKQKKKKNGKLEDAATVTEENANVVTVSELAETVHRKKSKKSKKRKIGDDEEKLLSD